MNIHSAPILSFIGGGSIDIGGRKLDNPFMETGQANGTCESLNHRFEYNSTTAFRLGSLLPLVGRGHLSLIISFRDCIAFTRRGDLHGWGWKAHQLPQSTTKRIFPGHFALLAIEPCYWLLDPAGLIILYLMLLRRIQTGREKRTSL